MDDYPLLNLFWTMLWLFLWVMWFFLLFKVITDIFRDHELHGWGKAGWLILVLLLPYLGVLVYLIVRGKSMSQRDVKQAQANEKAFQDYVQKAAGPRSSPAEELAKLSSLKEQGHLTQQEFDKAKEKLLA
ncbi:MULTISPECIES: SHOCT domain-containing protein [unclassified Streptomyces]|uniref:SHOCT domain-containing protein n=1 Tax=unclassified Streptomyces TaxID=2593676 RepID=UPI00202DBB6A|nr:MULTISPECIES: SHOCT domain-containing protein [unclassified Streptomyces]MCM1971363.1 SHOCT domain-containing protein [Streptomyces sp. G1]MCX5123582.1 SHOCT domain-containing protein [Streptomyces sp. NBC_00347]